MKAYQPIHCSHLSTDDPWRSTTHDDSYFSHKDPIGERQAVFIDGLELPRRFANLAPGATFRIGETGFGTGLTWLLASACFLAHAPKSARLQWVSVEKHPLTGPDLERLHQRLALPEVPRRLSSQLCATWPSAVSGCHRRLLAHGRVLLDLHFGDAEAVLNGLSGRIDAWCLDGFSPRANPEMWSPAIFQAVSRLSVPNAPFSTYTAATGVKKGLAAAGFQVRAVPGFLGKRERLIGQRESTNEPVARPQPKASAGAPITVIGAGLAGAWTAHRLAVRGHSVRVFEQHRPASGGSGNPQGIAYAKLGLEATPISRLQLQALTWLETLLEPFRDAIWHRSGLLLLAQDPSTAAKYTKLDEANHWPSSIMTTVDRDAASEIAGMGLGHGGLWLPAAGWMNPHALVHALLDHPLIDVRPYQQLTDLATESGSHRITLTDPLGQAMIRESPIVILANAVEAARFLPFPMPLRPVRGQITLLHDAPSPKVPISGDAYIAPAIHGHMTCGATYTPNSDDLSPRDSDQHDNLRRTNSLFTHPQFTASMISGQRVSVRAATPDYAPTCGPVQDHRATAWPDVQGSLAVPAHGGFGLYQIGGLGSRGTLTAPLLADMLASHITGEVSPLDQSMEQAIAPHRFLLRMIRRGQI